MWEYADTASLLTANSVTSPYCIYCRTAMYRFASAAFHLPDSKRSLLAQPSVCPVCGWWSVFRVHQGEHPRTAGLAESYSGSIGALKELDLTDISTPLAEVRDYLLARREAIFSAHPRLIEEVVGGTFKSLGWETLVTPYSCDRGIDIFLNDSSGKLIGVQVRRYKKKRRIEAEQIRSLAGALQLAGTKIGIFVTTCSYRKGARMTASQFSALGTRIDLIDGKRFLDLLSLSKQIETPLSEDQLRSYVLSEGIHLGSGIHQDFLEGEDLAAREIALAVSLPNEILEIPKS